MVLEVGKSKLLDEVCFSMIFDASLWYLTRYEDLTRQHGQDELGLKRRQGLSSGSRLKISCVTTFSL